MRQHQTSAGQRVVPQDARPLPCSGALVDVNRRIRGDASRRTQLISLKLHTVRIPTRRAHQNIHRIVSGTVNAVIATKPMNHEALVP